MLNKLKIWLRNKREAKFTSAFHHELANLRHEKMIEEAEHLASRPARTIANAPVVKISVKKAA